MSLENSHPTFFIQQDNLLALHLNEYIWRFALAFFWWNDLSMETLDMSGILGNLYIIMLW